MSSGDWMCASCQHLNFKKRDACQRCHCPKFATPDEVSAYGMNRTEVLAGDWYCATFNCGTHNYASRTACYRCGAFKDYSAMMTPSTAPCYGYDASVVPGWKTGDWLCNRRSSSRRVRVPLRFGVTIYNHAGKNIKRNGDVSNQNSQISGDILGGNVSRVMNNKEIDNQLGDDEIRVCNVSKVNQEMDEKTGTQVDCDVSAPHVDCRVYDDIECLVTITAYSPMNKKLSFKPTVFNEDGNEFVVFEEELVNKGSQKWKLTVCGYLLGCKMNANALSNEEGMNKILEQSPWIVNNRPLAVQKWDPLIGLEKTKQTKIPLWAKLTNVPLEAWTCEEISALASSLGMPLIMDSMTALMCQNGRAKTEYARVLVEFDVKKGFKEEIVVQYRDKGNVVRGTKVVKGGPTLKCCYQRKELRTIKVRKKSTNKFAVLNDLQGENMKELYMIAYFKMKWEEDRAKEGNVQNASMEDVVDSGVEGDKVWSTNEPAKLADASKRDFGGWNWCSNSVHSLSGCRILIGWNSDVVNLMVVKDCYGIAKCIVNDAPLLLVGGFNVTLFPVEHSAGRSTVTNDMQELCDCINDIEVEDASSSGLFFTWLKSPLAPTTSVMKKLDGDMINKGFMTAFGNYTTQFIPFVTSDHSAVVMSIPNGVIRKFKAFKFAEFIETVEKE
ncbi:zinc finger, RanBP2-type containing protein [Tanacetum coccineum]